MPKYTRGLTSHSYKEYNPTVKETYTETVKMQIRMERYKAMKAVKKGCIVPASKWDGDTGIPKLLKMYRTENNMEPEQIERIKELEKETAELVRHMGERKPRYERTRRRHWQDSDTHKQCRACGEILPREMFNKSSRASDGLISYCRTCDRLRRRMNYKLRKIKNKSI